MKGPRLVEGQIGAMGELCTTRVHPRYIKCLALTDGTALLFFDRDAVDLRRRAAGAIVSVARLVDDLVHHLEPRRRLSEDRVLPVEERRIRVHDEELGARGI